MIFLYLIAIIPAIIGIVLYMCHRDVTWLEWLGSTAVAFLFSAIIHVIVLCASGYDVETWSGQITKAVFYPRWVERYTDTHAYTVGSGKNARTHYRTETHHRTHQEHWNTETSLDQDMDISQAFYNEVVKNLGGVISKEDGHKSGFHSGDPHIYVTRNKSGYIYPVTDVRSWENKIKAGPSVFSFSEVPKGTPVYEYPPNGNWLKSDRLLGNVPINLLEFDRMNSRLGPLKKVNIILINFGNKDASIGKWQQAKWIGGKKNDLVICYGGQTQSNANWSFCFGWTENEIVKRNIETIVLEHKIDNSILPLIEQEVRKNYQIKNWEKFNYITVYPPTWSYWVLIVLLIVSQGAFWFWATNNDFSKESNYNSYQRSQLFRR